jgi:hypothetical protein
VNPAFRATCRSPEGALVVVRVAIMLSQNSVDILANTKGFFFLTNKHSTAILQPLDPYQFHRQLRRGINVLRDG